MWVAATNKICATIFKPIFLFYLLIHLSTAQSCSSNDPACTRVCNITSNTTFPTWTVNSPEDVRALSPPGCNLINASIAISTSFSGQFVLSGIQAIKGRLWTKGTLLDPAQNISAISMPDLLTLKGFFVRDSPQLTWISMPSLNNISTLNLELSGAARLNFTSLTNATNIAISGPIDLEFGSLVHVGGSLEISSSATFQDLAAYGQNLSSMFPPLAIKFPSLVNASGINLSGNLSEIYMPNLAIARNGPLTNGIVVETYGNPIDISFPKLYKLRDAFLAGTVQNISLPSLQNVSGHISIQAVTPISLNLASLVNVTDISLQGNITGVALPSLKNITTLSIFSSAPLSCTSTQEIFESIRNSTKGYQCYSSSSPGSSSTLSSGAKVSIGLGVAFAACMILVCVYGVWWLRKQNRELVKPRASEHELQDRGQRGAARGIGLGDSPPDYNSMAGTEFGSVHSDDTAVAVASERPVSLSTARENEDGAATGANRTGEEPRPG